MQAAHKIEGSIAPRLVLYVSALGIASPLLVSCSSSRAPILATISASVETDQKWAQGTPFHRTLSLSAAAPFTDIANVWRYDPKAGYATAIGVTRCQSFISRTVVENPEGYDADDLQRLQVALLKLQQYAADRVTYRFQKELLPREQRYMKPEIVQTTGLAPDGSMPVAENTYVVQKNIEAETIAGQYEDVLQKYREAYQEVAALVNKPGIVVMRWQSEAESEGNLKLSGIASLGGSKGRRFGGLIVAAGLRQSILHVGPDIYKLSDWIPSHQLEHMKVTTHLLQAKRAIWVKDITMESVFGTKLRYSLNNGDLKQALNAAQIELALAKASITNLASLGYFSQPKRSVETVDWSVDGNIRRLESPDWFTLLMVDTEVRNLERIVSRGGGCVPR